MTRQEIERHLDTLNASGISRSREAFLSTLLGSLADSLEDAVGLEDAEAFVTVVGAFIGDEWNAEYLRAFGDQELTLEQICASLIDLKSRIGGEFRIVEIDEDRIVLRNNRCPFGETVQGRRAMCQMTSSVFGRIVADNCGYARVSIPESIAKGDLGCTVVIDLREDAARGGESNEYFRRRSQ